MFVLDNNLFEDSGPLFEVSLCCSPKKHHLLTSVEYESEWSVVMRLWDGEILAFDRFIITKR